MDEVASFWRWLRRDVDCFPDWAVYTYVSTLAILVLGTAATLVFATMKLGWSVPVVIVFIALWIGWSKMYALYKEEKV